MQKIWVCGLGFFWALKFFNFGLSNEKRYVFHLVQFYFRWYTTEQNFNFFLSTEPYSFGNLILIIFQISKVIQLKINFSAKYQILIYSAFWNLRIQKQKKNLSMKVADVQFQKVKTSREDHYKLKWNLICLFYCMCYVYRKIVLILFKNIDLCVYASFK